MAQVNPEFTIVQAEALGQSVYDLISTSWGIRDPNGPPANLQWPPEGSPNIPIALAGIAIGPTSDVDRVWVTYNRQQGSSLLGPNPSIYEPLIRRVSLDSPLIYAMPAQGLSPAGVQPIASSDFPQNAMRDGMLYVYPMVGGSLAFPPITYDAGSYMDTTVLPTAFVNAFTGASTPFGTVANVADKPIVFYAPRLHLLLYLKPPILPPAKRAPLCITSAIANNTHSTAITTLTCIAQIPIFGRERIRIMVCSSTGATKGATFTAGVLRNINEDGTCVFETHHATQNSDSSVPQFMTISDPCGDYLTLWATPQVEGENVVIQWSVTAYDGPGTLQGC